eukprot:GHVS01105720.1.p1 GENE.GHVS01105720.1~~GHVS01105720.1.p1  ORF type:complete len:530 (+),score=116.70 GHVS01105720.1:85-1590(+)
MSLLHRPFHVCLLCCLVLLSLLSSRAAADAVSSPAPPSSNSCPDCSGQAQAEDRLAKMGAELSHLKQINEESVKACNLVSQKQVESLEECQKSQQQLGELLNKAQEEKQELNAKTNSMMKESIEKEISCGKRVEAAAGQGAQRVAEAEAKAMAAEHAAATSEQEAVRKELSGQLDGAAGRIGELMEEIKKKETEHKMVKEAAGKVEGGLKADLSVEQKKLQVAEKSLQQAQSQLVYMRHEMDSLKKKSTESSSYLYSFRSFHNSVFGLRDLSLAVFSSALARVPQNYKDNVHQMYTEGWVMLMEPVLNHPIPRKLADAGGKQWEMLRDLYNAHLGRENGYVSAMTRKLSSVMEGAHSRGQEWNEAVTKGVLNQFIQEHPEVEQLIPDGLLDRSMCCLFLLVSLFVAYKLMIMTALPLARFAVCQICGCRMCARRGSSRGTKRVHSTKKRLTSPTSNSSSSSGQRKKPTESLQVGGKPFRPDESSGTATTTSSSTGSGIKRK